MTSRSAQLKEEVAALEKALSEISAGQAAMDKIRAEEHAAFTSTKAELTEGIQGVQQALRRLKDYYGQDTHTHDEARGAGAGIIGLQELVESDFTSGRAEATQSESSSQFSYEREAKDNQVETTAKNADVKYMTRESTSLDKWTLDAIQYQGDVGMVLAVAPPHAARGGGPPVRRCSRWRRRMPGALAGDDPGGRQSDPGGAAPAVPVGPPTIASAAPPPTPQPGSFEARRSRSPPASS